MKPINTGVYFSALKGFDPHNHPQLKGVEVEAFWLIHKIISLSVQRRHDVSSFQNISRKTMEQFIHPSKVTPLLEALTDLGIIESNHHYVIGVHSTGYKIAKDWRGQVERVECPSRSMARKILAHRIRRMNFPIPEAELGNVQQHLLKWLRQVRIDTTTAYQVVQNASLPHRKASTKRLSGKGEQNLKQKRKAAVGYYQSILRMTVDQIANGDVELIECEYGRIHTPITRLFTAARDSLFFECHEPLVNLDIRNSQLVFFSLAMIEHYYSNHVEDSPVDLKIVALRGYGAVGSGKGEPEGSNEGKLLPDDVTLFVNSVMSGTVYDELLEAHNKMVLPADKINDRKTFKKSFFQQVLFGDQKWNSHKPLSLMMQKDYPSVWEYISEVKAGGYEQVAREMQRRESQYMVKQVCQRLMNHHSDIPILTIHDSIMCPADKVETVRRVMMEEFGRLGVQPSIR